MNSPMERIDSGDTDIDDSPFGSNLVTPTDEPSIHVIKAGLTSSIDERIVMAKASLDYFSNGGIENEGGRRPTLEKNEDSPIELGTRTYEVQLESGIPPVGGAALSPDSEPLDKEEYDGDISHLSTLDSNQTFPSSHPSVLELAAQCRRRSSALYNLPNSHISINDQSSSFESDAEGEDTILQEDSYRLLEEMESTPDLLFSLSWPADAKTLLSQPDLGSVFWLACRILLFLPWCIAVGGAIVFSPTNMSSLAFAPSLNYISPPPTPIQLYAHWADYGLPHVTIFLGFIAVVLWIFPNAGWLVLGALAAQFCWVWHDFLPDKTVALGEDERQMVYLLAQNTWLTGNSIRMKRRNEGYYVTDSHDQQLTGDSDLDDMDFEEI